VLICTNERCLRAEVHQHRHAVLAGTKDEQRVLAHRWCNEEGRRRRGKWQAQVKSSRICANLFRNYHHEQHMSPDAFTPPARGHTVYAGGYGCDRMHQGETHGKSSGTWPDSRFEDKESRLERSHNALMDLLTMIPYVSGELPGHMHQGETQYSPSEDLVESTKSKAAGRWT